MKHRCSGEIDLLIILYVFKNLYFRLSHPHFRMGQEETTNLKLVKNRTWGAVQKFALKLAVPLSGLSYRVIHIKVSLNQINLLGLI